MRPGRLVIAAGWAVVLGGGAGALATAAGRRARRLGLPAVIAQAIVPWSALAAWPVIAIAALGGRRRHGLVATGAAVGAAGIAIAVRTAGSATPSVRPDGGQALSIVHANLLYRNTRLARSVPMLRELPADVLAFVEYTPAHAAVLAAGLGDLYPYRLDHADPGAHGIALWSRHPMREVPAVALGHERVTGDVTMRDGRTIRILAVHPISPPHTVGRWRTELAVLAREPPPIDRPAVMIGDFNASWNHPELRAVMATGWRSAHRDRGRGLSASWPNHRIVPPFVRLDHALVNDHLSVVAVDDFTVAGSDHRGLIVTVSATPLPVPTPPPAPSPGARRATP